MDELFNPSKLQSLLESNCHTKDPQELFTSRKTEQTKEIILKLLVQLKEHDINVTSDSTFAKHSLSTLQDFIKLLSQEVKKLRLKDPKSIINNPYSTAITTIAKKLGIEFTEHIKKECDYKDLQPHSFTIFETNLLVKCHVICSRLVVVSWTNILDQKNTQIVQTSLDSLHAVFNWCMHRYIMITWLDQVFSNKLKPSTANAYLENKTGQEVSLGSLVQSIGHCHTLFADVPNNVKVIQASSARLQKLVKDFERKHSPKRIFLKTLLTGEKFLQQRSLSMDVLMVQDNHTKNIIVNSLNNKDSNTPFYLVYVLIDICQRFNSSIDGIQQAQLKDMLLLLLDKNKYMLVLEFMIQLNYYLNQLKDFSRKS